tara:strand:+ start:125 stop:577 length:453 start_codon:yes stop_codon:yes gene_type:complete
MDDCLVTEICFSNTQAISLVSGEHLDSSPPGVVLNPAKKWTDCFTLIRKLEIIDDISINFSTFTDGRGYSLAARIKEQQIVKRIHAVGKITEELAYFLRRSGFDVAHFPIRKNSISSKNVDETNKLLNPFSNHYQLGNDDRVENMEKNLI